MKVNSQKAKFSIKLLLMMLGVLGLATPVFSKLSGSLTEEAIEDRIKPVGRVEVSGKTNSAVKKSLSPKTIYTKHCATCHSSGLLGAPKPGDKSDWNTRMSKGAAAVLKNAVQGYKNMPAMGTCFKCSEDDIKNTIDYMLK